jgi:hypothetical protein
VFQITGNPEIRNAKWSTDDGKPTEGSRAIFPLCASDENGNLEFVGTGFFVCTNGIFVTAKHVVMESAEKPIDPLTAIQFLGNNQYILRPVKDVSTNNSDLAIGTLAPATHQHTAEPLVNSILTLTAVIPPRASIITTFAYPKTTIKNKDRIREMRFETSWHSGFIVEFLRQGRDRVMLPEPCYRTTMEILHGASGGPVMNSFAQVFGINSTGYQGVQESYVSAIQSIGGLQINDVMLPGDDKARPVTTNELIARGYIIVQAH